MCEMMRCRCKLGETRSGFHLGRVSAAGIDLEFIPGSDQCAEHDSYGSTGHVRLQDRDYSQAREQPALAPDPWLLEE